jgi:hypothetical protein
MTMRCKDGGLRRTKKDNERIDLVLAVMCAIQLPGECVPRDVIADLTGMSHGGPWAIEQRALKKLRTRLRYTTHRQLGQENAA